jgi:hypothetical protein
VILEDCAHLEEARKALVVDKVCRRFGRMLRAIVVADIEDGAVLLRWMGNVGC